MSLNELVAEVRKYDENKKIVEFKNGFAVAYERQGEFLTYHVIDQRLQDTFLTPLDRPSFSSDMEEYIRAYGHSPARKQQVRIDNYFAGVFQEIIQMLGVEQYKKRQWDSAKEGLKILPLDMTFHPGESLNDFSGTVHFYFNTEHRGYEATYRQECKHASIFQFCLEKPIETSPTSCKGTYVHLPLSLAKKLKLLTQEAETIAKEEEQLQNISLAEHAAFLAQYGWQINADKQRQKYCEAKSIKSDY